MSKRKLAELSERLKHLSRQIGEDYRFKIVGAYGAHKVVLTKINPLDGLYDNVLEMAGYVPMASLESMVSTIDFTLQCKYLAKDKGLPLCLE